MPTESSPQSPEAELRERVIFYLQQNLPQIAMHGGQAAITDIDVEARTVSLSLGGACSGCGISPMTVQAIKRRLPPKIEGIDEVYVDMGLDDLGDAPRADSDASF